MTPSYNRDFHANIFLSQSEEEAYEVLRGEARDFLCQNSERACGKCRSCLDFSKDNHPDYLEIGEDKGYIKIESIRDMIRWTGLRPMESPYKIVAIPSCHNLTKEAANALLKSLEEPEDYLKFLMTTNKLSQVLPTIRSRCQLVRLLGSQGESGISESDKIEVRRVLDGVIGGDYLDIFSHGDLWNGFKDQRKEVYSLMVDYIWEKLWKLDEDGGKDPQTEKLKAAYIEAIKNIDEMSSLSVVNINLQLSVEECLLNLWENIYGKSSRREI